MPLSTELRIFLAGVAGFGVITLVAARQEVNAAWARVTATGFARGVLRADTLALREYSPTHRAATGLCVRRLSDPQDLAFTPIWRQARLRPMQGGYEVTFYAESSAVRVTGLRMAVSATWPPRLIGVMPTSRFPSDSDTFHAMAACVAGAPSA